jgi:hypothetical protein
MDLYDKSDKAVPVDILMQVKYICSLKEHSLNCIDTSWTGID